MILHGTLQQYKEANRYVTYAGISVLVKDVATHDINLKGTVKRG